MESTKHIPAVPDAIVVAQKQFIDVAFMHFRTSRQVPLKGSEEQWMAILWKPSPLDDGKHERGQMRMNHSLVRVRSTQ